MEIHVRIKNQAYGPYTPAQIHELLDDGRLKLSDPAWHAGLADWATLSQVLAQVGAPKMPPAPVPVAEGPRCPKCDSPLSSEARGACAYCGYNPRVASGTRKHPRSLDPMVEEAQRKAALTQLAAALLIGGLLPVYTGKSQLAFPNLQPAGHTVLMACVLIGPVALGALLLLAGGVLKAPWRGIAGLVFGLMFGVTALWFATTTHAPIAAAWQSLLPQGMEKVRAVLFGKPLIGGLLALGVPGLLLSLRLRRYRPNSRAAYWIGCASGLLVLGAWLVPQWTDDKGAVLLARALGLFKQEALLGLAGLTAATCAVGATLCLALATDGRSADAISNLCGYARRLVTTGVVLVSLMLLGYWALLNLPGKELGNPLLRELGALAGQAGMTLKALLWFGGGTMLLVWSATEILAGPADNED